VKWALHIEFYEKNDMDRNAKRWRRNIFLEWISMWNSRVRNWIVLESHISFGTIFSFTCSVIHSLIHSFIGHLFIYSFFHSFVHSFIHSSIQYWKCLIAMLCICRFLIRCFMSDVRNNIFLNCNFTKLLKYESTNFWTTFLQLGVHWLLKTSTRLIQTEF